jgi:hypothetical protein
LLLFVGDDWAEDHHDVELQNEAGRRLAWARLPEGVAGMADCTRWLASGSAVVGMMNEFTTSPRPTATTPPARIW